MDAIGLDWTMKLICFIRSKERIGIMISKIATACREQRDPMFEQALLRLMRDLRPEIRHITYDTLTNISQESLSETAKKALEKYRAENPIDKKFI